LTRRSCDARQGSCKGRNVDLVTIALDLDLMMAFLALSASNGTEVPIKSSRWPFCICTSMIALPPLNMFFWRGTEIDRVLDDIDV